MQNIVVGVIGCGNMGGAILKGLAPHASITLLAHDHSRSKVEALNQSLGQERIAWHEGPQALAAAADLIILAVKPHQIEAMCAAIAPALAPHKILLSVAAAVSLAQLAKFSQGACPVVRSMPNLPLLAGKGVFGLCLDNPQLREDDKALLQELFSLMGLVVVLPEDKFSAFSAVAGCGPAYVCLLMEGMQNAAVSLGLSAAQARDIVAATVEGSAHLALQGQESFADLRAKVCSPGGTTIQAVNHLERTGVRGHVTDAVVRAYNRDQEMAAAKK